MHTLLVVLASNLATFGFAFFLAGVWSLAVPSLPEMDAAREAYERERAKAFGAVSYTHGSNLGGHAHRHFQKLRSIGPSGPRVAG